MAVSSALWCPQGGIGGEEGKELSNLVGGGGGMAEAPVDVQGVVAASADPVSGEVAGLLKVLEDGQGGDCPINGVSGGFYWVVLAVGMRSAKVVANAFNAGFQRMPHLVCPVPLGSNDLTTR